MNDIVRAATSLTLPWPPSVNAYKMPVRMGSKIVLVLTKRAREYRLEVATAIAQQLGRRRATTCYTTPVSFSVELRAPDRRRRDIDNHVKMLQDALVAAGILRDDYLIDALTVTRGRQIADGCANVIIETLDAQPEMPEPTQHVLEIEEERPF